MKRNKLFFVDEVREYEYSFLNNSILEMSGSHYEVPFATEPTIGGHSLESCPNCREYRLNLIEEIEQIVEKFPNCCDYHKNLSKKDFFNLNDFKDIATITANKVVYTYHHILNNVDEDDWYNEIIAYLNYTIESFGKMPIDCGEPFRLSSYYSALKKLLKNIENELTSDKVPLIDLRTRINKVIKLIDVDNEPLEEESKTDLNLLLKKYDEWFKAFPFDLPYFKHLEIKFRKLIPLHTGRERQNKYLGTVEREMHTKESLTVFLLQTTQNILSTINGATLYEKNLLNNTEKIAIDLVIQNRKLELLELSAMPNTKKFEYIKVIKKWFKQEKNFITDITPLLKELPPGRTNNNENNVEDESNDFLISTIQDFLEPMKMYFNDKDYDLLVEELESYFKTGAFTSSNEIVKTVNRPNKKFIGWQLKELYNNCRNDNTKLSIEYLRFGKQRISIFKDVTFDESNYLKSNLYKYYNTKVRNT